MSTNIMMNKSHIVDDSNSHFVYTFPTTLHLSQSSTVAISKLQLFYSWFNVSARYQNNTITILWWDASGNLTVPYTCVFSDGYYSVATMNEYLIQFMIKNKLYLLSKDGTKNVFFIGLRQNSTNYSIEVVYNSLSDVYTDGTAAASPYTDWFLMPSGSTWIPPAGYEIPQLVNAMGQKFGLLIGQPVGAIIPSVVPDGSSVAAGVYTKGSLFTPQMEPSSSFFVTCNMCTNPLSKPNTILDSFTLTPDASFGQMMSPLTSEKIMCRAKEGDYQSIEIRIFDQDFSPLQIKDPNILIILSIMHD